MLGFAELNAHEQKMLNIWMEYWAASFDGLLDDVDEDYGFADWLKGEIEFYESEDMAEYAEDYRMALAEWQA